MNIKSQNIKFSVGENLPNTELLKKTDNKTLKS